jgi:hyperosmotically inducible protein
MTTRLYWLPLWLILGCSQAEKDKDIKGMITMAARQEAAFAGVRYTVRDGVVVLGGLCPTKRAEEEVLLQVRNTAGVKDVRNGIRVAPVMLDSDFSLRKTADSVLMKYARVQAEVHDSVIILQGELPREELPDLLKSINELKAKGIVQQLALE